MAATQDFSATPVRDGGCACGGECPDCRKRKSPPSTRLALRNPGRPLEPRTRSLVEPGLGRDLGDVRVHDDAAAARSASDLGAQAWTLGSDIFFAGGRYAPQTPAGAGLLAHELAHVAQQAHFRHPAAADVDVADSDSAPEREADRFVASLGAGRTPQRPSPAAEPRIHRSVGSAILDVLLFIPRLFGLEVFTAGQLREYLDGLKQRKAPEDGIFSDNKARACVNRENEFGPYDTDTKTLLVREMLGGHVSFLDEGSIITLLRRAMPAERDAIVSAIGRDAIWSKFDGGNRRILEALTLKAADAGDALVTRLRSLSQGELADYAANATDPAVKDSINKAMALSKMTAPVPVEAQMDPAGNAKLVINGVKVTASPDRINPSLGNHAYTHGDFHFSTPAKIDITAENANTPMGHIDPPEISIDIFTEYPSEESKSKSSAYGVGTRPGDVNTLQTHEHAHGEAWFKFLRDFPPPASKFTDGMLPAAYNAEVDRWTAARDAWAKQAGIYALKAGDCVGTLPTEEQYEGTGFHASICHEP